MTSSIRAIPAYVRDFIVLAYRPLKYTDTEPHMHRKTRATALFFTAFLAIAPSASIPEVKPESVGLSHERLARIHETMERYIAAHQVAGAVTLVARQGHVVHLEAHGLSDIESAKPMAKDSMFRIWSMTKPVAGTAILMLIEEGKVRLNDPVSKFIPEFKGQKVAVAQERVPGQPASFYMIPAAREITIQDLLTHVSGLGSGPGSAAEITEDETSPGRIAGRCDSSAGRDAARFSTGLALDL